MTDIFNFVSQEKYDALEKEFDRMKRERDTALEAYGKLQEAIKGKRVCTSYCESCFHGVPIYQPFGGITTYICDMDCMCKDYERRRNRLDFPQTTQ